MNTSTAAPLEPGRPAHRIFHTSRSHTMTEQPAGHRPLRTPPIVPARPPAPPLADAVDQAALRDRIAAALREHGTVHLGDQVPADEYDCCADAVLAMLPATTDRAAEEAYRLSLSTALRLGTGANWEAIRDRAEDLVAEVEELAAARRPLPAEATAPLAAGLPLVKGRCPTCGRASLFLGDGGYVTCSHADCPEPDAASTTLEQPAVGAQQPEAAEGPAIPRATALREAVTAMEELMADGEHEPGALVERVREMADEAAAQQPKEA